MTRSALTKRGRGLFAAAALVAAAPAFAGNGVSAEEAQEVWSAREATAQLAGGGGDAEPAHCSKGMRMACCSRAGGAGGGGGAGDASSVEEDPSYAGPG